LKDWLSYQTLILGSVIYLLGSISHEKSYLILSNFIMVSYALKPMSCNADSDKRKPNNENY